MNKILSNIPCLHPCPSLPYANRMPVPIFTQNDKIFIRASEKRAREKLYNRISRLTPYQTMPKRKTRSNRVYGRLTRCVKIWRHMHTRYARIWRYVGMTRHIWRVRRDIGAYVNISGAYLELEVLLWRSMHISPMACLALEAHHMQHGMLCAHHIQHATLCITLRPRHKNPIMVIIIRIL